MKLQFKSEFSCIRSDQLCIRIYSTSDPIGSQRHNYRNREGMPIRKVINRLLLRSQECSDWFDESGQTDSSAYRTKDHVLFFSNTRSRTFFFSPPNRWPTSKKSDHKWRIDGTTSGLINSVTALHGRVSFRSAICHVPKGTYKQNEAVSTQFMHDPRTRSISFYFACLIWSLELLYRYFFFAKFC